jgi:hypothetical protein
MQREPRNARLARLPFVKLQVLGLMQTLVAHVKLIAMHVLLVISARRVQVTITNIIKHVRLAALRVRRAALQAIIARLAKMDFI